jgi:flavorubredoxin
MESRVTEIADRAFQITTTVPEVPVAFNTYLLTGEEPLIFHTGLRNIYPNVSEAVGRIIPLETLRWISFGHFEADECGSMNQWLAAAPDATVAHTAIGVMVSVDDVASRPARPLTDGEVLDLGGHEVRHLTTPQVPHAWDAGCMYDETTKTLLCGDLFTWMGPYDETTGDLMDRAVAAEDVFHSTVIAPETGRTIRRLAELEIETLAPMHAPIYNGDCSGALLALADDYDRRLEAVS